MFIGNFKNNFKFKYIFYCRETIKGFQQRLKCIVDIWIKFDEGLGIEYDLKK